MKTILISKARMYGDSINSRELLQALKNPIVGDEGAPVTVSTRNCTEVLNMVVLCESCDSLHLICGKLSREQYEFAHTCYKIFAEHNYDGAGVTVGELKRILSALPQTREISLTHLEDGNYTLTEVYKCSPTCQAIHLDSSYEGDSILPN